MSKILLIEHDSAASQMLHKVLQEGGFEVEVAERADTGLEMLKSVNPSLIILDESAPGKTAQEFLQAVQVDVNVGFVPIIVVSSAKDVQAFIDLGACDVLSKTGMSPENIIGKVQKCFAMSGGSLGKTAGQGISAGTMPGTAAKGKAAQGSGAPSTKKVLIVEDDQFLSELSQTKLGKVGYQVVAALDGETGLQMATSEKPDIILLDILLPGIDGFEVLRQLKSHQDKAIRNIPVLLLSNYGQEEKIQKGMALGAVDYLVKANFTTNEIVNKLQAILDGQRG